MNYENKMTIIGEPLRLRCFAFGSAHMDAANAPK